MTIVISAEQEQLDRMFRWIASALRCQKLLHQKYPAVLVHRPRIFLLPTCDN